MQNNQHGCLYSRGTTERQDEAHGAPDPEADEYERNEDQLLIRSRGGGTSLRLAPLTDGPVFRERLVLCGEQGAKSGMSQTGLLSDHLCASSARASRGRQEADIVVFSTGTLGRIGAYQTRRVLPIGQLPDRRPWHSTSPQK